MILAAAAMTAQDSPSLAPVAPLPPPFELWMSSLRAEAAARGIRPEIIEQALAGARSFLLYPNYEAILGYNCAHTYALSVALLSDRLH